MIHHIHLSSNCVDNLFILQDRNIYVLYTDTNFETMAKNSIDGGVFWLAAKLLGRWVSAALKPVTESVKKDVAHTLDNTFGNKVVNIKWHRGYRVDDIKWIMSENRPEIKWYMIRA